MRLCVPTLTVTHEQLARDTYFVLEDDDQIAGFGSLRFDGAEAELTNLFVEPWGQRRGYGTLLWHHACTLAQAHGVTEIRIESDPFAEVFYRAMGAERVGDVPSDAIPGRVIPLLTYKVPRG
jgi:N-acetylglutamate synthase-like GNAT family acetyltransferase